ncbi:hypothetical protein AsAng_0003740 [Aureispira anguillae]|uniref:Uncharacterized protein n=1 Tax=Aureispira anguillae TaxID=2864201 RepID=A0A915VML2_9BACT|nr:hypothetical protein AsAng_0003740 [Aureispira anguillae]
MYVFASLAPYGREIASLVAKEKNQNISLLIKSIRDNR